MGPALRNDLPEGKFKGNSSCYSYHKNPDEVKESWHIVAKYRELKKKSVTQVQQEEFAIEETNAVV